MSHFQLMTDFDAVFDEECNGEGFKIITAVVFELLSFFDLF